MVELRTIIDAALAAPIPYVLVPALTSLTITLTFAPEAKIPTPFPEALTRVIVPLTDPDPLGAIKTALLVLSVSKLSDTVSALAAGGAKLIPELINLRTDDL